MSFGERRSDGSIARLDALPPELERAALDVARELLAAVLARLGAEGADDDTGR